MDVFDFFFPEQAEAEHLNKISKSIHKLASKSENAITDTNQIRSLTDTLQHKVAELERDRDELILIILALLKNLCATSDLTIEQLKTTMLELDKIDGSEDGRISKEALQAAFGLFRPYEQKPNQPDTPICENCSRPVLKTLDKCIYCGGSPKTE